MSTISKSIARVTVRKTVSRRAEGANHKQAKFMIASLRAERLPGRAEEVPQNAVSASAIRNFPRVSTWYHLCAKEAKLPEDLRPSDDEDSFDLWRRVRV